VELATTERRCESPRTTWTIHHLTDLHVDDEDHAEKELEQRIKEIAADPFALWLGGGDYGSLIVPGDPRFSTGPDGTVHRIPDLYIERLEELFAPIADKCIGLGTGNHERTIMSRWHRGVAAELAMRLGIAEKYIGERGWALISFKGAKGAGRNSQQTFRCYQYHGWSAGRLKGRKALQAERDLGGWNADAFFLGHDHQPYADLFWTQEPYHASRKGWRLRTKPRSVINGGSWTYGQRPPADAATKRSRKASEWPSERWVESKNFRPQGPVSPILLVTIDFGHGASHNGEGRKWEGRSMGYELEIRQLASPVYS
jgi:hypothetical protein